MLPQGHLFIAGQRIPEKGWRWALQIFGNNKSRQLNVFGARVDGTPAKRSAQGLSNEYAGFIIAADQQPESPDDFVVEVPSFQQEETWILRVVRHDDDFRKICVARNLDKDVLRFDMTSLQLALAIFFYNPNPQPALNLFMAAVMTDVERGSEYDVVNSTVSDVNCTYRDLQEFRSWVVKVKLK
jgi:hypothetical protein